MSLLRRMLGARRDTASLFQQARGELDHSEADAWAYGIVGLIDYVERAEAAEGRSNASYSSTLRHLIRVALREDPLPKDPNDA